MVQPWYSREIHHGLARYGRVNHWHLKAIIGHKPVPTDWDGDGLIVRLGSKETGLYNQVKKLNLPTVFIGNYSRLEGLPCVSENYHLQGNIAADYFYERGFRNFGYYGTNAPASLMRKAGFKERIDQLGNFKFLDINLDYLPRSWKKSKISLGEMMKKSPKPLAVFCSREMLALDVIDAAVDYGLAVPEEVAVLGVGNDELICESVDISVSSIDNRYDIVGYEAAKLLERAMAGEKLSTQPVLVDPLPEVVTRRSTDIVAIPNLGVAKVLRYIADYFREPLTIYDLVYESGMSRASLFKQFKHHLGRSPLQEVTRLRLHESKRLLLETNDTVEVIAKKSGFGTPWSLYNTFKRQLKITPYEFRQKNSIDS